MKKDFSTPRPEFVADLKKNLLKSYDAQYGKPAPMRRIIKKTWGSVLFWRFFGAMSFAAVAFLLVFPQRAPSNIPIEKVRRTAYSYVITSDSLMEQEKIMQSLIQEEKDYPELYKNPTS